MLHEYDAKVCLNVPAEFRPAGQFFRNFSQASDVMYRDRAAKRREDFGGG
jgi:predicted phosphoribosyltransferase